MGSSAAIAPEFLEAFRARAGAAGVLTFADFMALALYHPEVGYYRRDRARVGRGPGTDFYTASSSGAMFGGLVAAAGAELLGADATAHTFVEIGAEPGGGVLAGVTHPFAGVRTIRVGEPLALAGRCLVFANELFDAQPLRRFVRRGAEWRELGVALRGGQLVEVEIGPVTAKWLPGIAPEGYRFDAPRAANDLLAAIAAQPWTGLLLAFDYGKSWDELAAETPAGTVRAYHRHRQSNDLLATPGEQDLTGHVCWDWLAVVLAGAGFVVAGIESQEAFFVHQAGPFLARELAAAGGGVSPRKQALLQLLHPAHLGQKFQVLRARRAAPPVLFAGG